MYVRTAYFEGPLSDDEKAAFQHAMITNVAPIIRSFPGCRGVQLNVPRALEPDAPQQSLLMIQHSYESPEALEAALASTQRQESLAATQAAMAPYDIRVFHINHERAEID